MKNAKDGGKKISPDHAEKLLQVLKARFEKNPLRHRDLEWAKVQARLTANPDKLWSLQEMERTGGEPDVVGKADATGEYRFMDCAEESPKGRRSLCYDREAWEERKAAKPVGSALEMAAAMGIDLKSSSWVITPDGIRKLGGALFCDHRYDHVFVYHNGAQAYYAARAFRGLLKV